MGNPKRLSRHLLLGGKHSEQVLYWNRTHIVIRHNTEMRKVRRMHHANDWHVDWQRLSIACDICDRYPDAMVGGSAALVLQGKLVRSVSDIDIVVTDPVVHASIALELDPDEVFEERASQMAGDYRIFGTSYGGVKVDLMLNPVAKATNVNVNRSYPDEATPVPLRVQRWRDVVHYKAECLVNSPDEDKHIYDLNSMNCSADYEALVKERERRMKQELWGPF